MVQQLIFALRQEVNLAIVPGTSRSQHYPECRTGLQFELTNRQRFGWGEGFNSLCIHAEIIPHMYLYSLASS